MKVLVINCGSSSLKYQLIDSDSEKALAKGLCERIGIDGSQLTHQPAGKGKITTKAEMPDHTVAVQMVFLFLIIVTDVGEGDGFISFLEAIVKHNILICQNFYNAEQKNGSFLIGFIL